MKIESQYIETICKNYSFQSSLSRKEDGQEEKGQDFMPFLICKPQELLNMIKLLKEKENLHYLHSISGVHLAEEVCDEEENKSFQHQGFEIVYHISSLYEECEKTKNNVSKSNHAVAIKVFFDAETSPQLPSIDSLYQSANWFEREVYDLYGVIFENSRNLSRIMLPPDWQGHPLRKDYQEQNSYNGMPTTRTSELEQKRVI